MPRIEEIDDASREKLRGVLKPEGIIIRDDDEVHFLATKIGHLYHVDHGIPGIHINYDGHDAPKIWAALYTRGLCVRNGMPFRETPQLTRADAEILQKGLDEIMDILGRYV